MQPPVLSWQRRTSGTYDSNGPVQAAAPDVRATSPPVLLPSLELAQSEVTEAADGSSATSWRIAAQPPTQQQWQQQVRWPSDGSSSGRLPPDAPRLPGWQRQGVPPDDFVAQKENVLGGMRWRQHQHSSPAQQTAQKEEQAGWAQLYRQQQNLAAEQADLQRRQLAFEQSARADRQQLQAEHEAVEAERQQLQADRKALAAAQQQLQADCEAVQAERQQLEADDAARLVQLQQPSQPSQPTAASSAAASHAIDSRTWHCDAPGSSQQPLCEGQPAGAVLSSVLCIPGGLVLELDFTGEQPVRGGPQVACAGC